MTSREFAIKFVESRNRVQQVHREIVDLVRSVIPVLKDHNLANLAKTFEEKLFILDAVEGELQNDSIANPEALIDMIRRMGESRD